MKAVMLVGGFGTRLRPLTITTPKPLLPLVNIPFLEIELLHLREYGVEEVILSTGYLPELFDNYFGTGEKLGMKLVHVTEKEPLGTCGAVKNVEQYVGDEAFIVCNGDILTDLDINALFEYHREKEAKVTITLTPVDDPTAYGLVPLEGDGRIKEFLEKPSWDEVVTNLINAGTYVLEPGVLEEVPPGKNYSFERELFPSLLDRGVPMYGYPSDCYWLDLGTPSKYLAAHHDILEGKINVPLNANEVRQGIFAGADFIVSETAELHPPVVVGNNVKVSKGARVGPLTTLGDGVVVGAGSKVEGSVVLYGSSLGKGCIVERSIIGRNTKIGDETHIAEEAVLGDNVEIGEGNELRRGIRIWPDAVVGSRKIRFSK
ncbi:MAG: NDP-sugar synthase [Actinomycetota bacterium]|nr:NDP-sugar synthase [Actinomycetota bacterium]